MTRSDKAEENRTAASLGSTPRSGDHLPVGLRVQGRYRILGDLGAGGYGTVYRAEDEATGHEVAVRLLMPRLFGAPATRERKRDAIVTASAAHPALTAVLEYGRDENGRDFAVMELLEGRRLSEILADGPLDVDHALRLGMDLGGAVETLHNAGLVYGALRPRNVMVSEDGRGRLMDVELSGLRGEQATKGPPGAEPPREYLSLEEIRRSAVTEETDVYALGVVLYEMLCGVPPFQAKTRDDLIKKQLLDTPTPLRRRRRAVPHAVESIVAQALSRRPERRPTIQSMLNCLWQEINRPARRWKPAVAIAAGIVLASSIPVLVGWGLLAPRVHTPPAAVQQPAPPRPVRPAPEVEPAAVGGATQPPTTAAGSASAPAPAAQPPAKVVTPTAPPSSSPSAAAVHRPPPPRAVPPATDRKREPAAASGSDEPDPGAFVDWVLERSAARRK